MAKQTIEELKAEFPPLPNKIFGSHMAQLEKANAVTGKSVAITGCTTGIGRTVAEVAAKLGASHVYLLNRKSARAEATEKAVQGVAKAGTKVRHIDCDLQSFASVKEAIKELKKECAKGLNVLYLNAGVMAMPERATVDGYDTQMQTNHLSHFMIASALLPELELAAEGPGEGRVVTISSGARNTPGGHLEAKYFDKLGAPGSLGGDDASMSGGCWVRYHQTKLANVVFALELASRLRAKGSKVKAACGEPGLATSDLQLTTIQEGGMTKSQYKFIRMLSQSADDGALPTLWACFHPGTMSGDFYVPGNFLRFTGAPKAIIQEGKPIGYFTKRGEKLALHEPSGKLLWDKSEAVCGPFFR